jgi:hypothetical protein
MSSDFQGTEFREKQTVSRIPGLILELTSSGWVAVKGLNSLANYADGGK